MAEAKLTETVVRTDTVTLVLSLEEAWALMSLVRHAVAPLSGGGPGRALNDVRNALRASGIPPAPSNRRFRASGTVTFSEYVKG